jgi:hypothetical protein
MRRGPRDGPKVWHNPDVLVPRRHPIVRTAPAEPPASTADDAIPPPAPSSRRQALRAAGKIISQPPPPDEKTLVRERLLDKLRTAEGRPAITRAANELLKAGHQPEGDDQDAFLQLLEHTDESVVQSAIDRLTAIISVSPIKRSTVLESRLRRLEELADDPATQASAARLRRQASGRPGKPTV